jgi:hypothetical protein
VSINATQLTRVRCGFDKANGDHEDVTWDPTQPDGLIKVLQLRGITDWQMSCSADPITLPAAKEASRFLVFTGDPAKKLTPETSTLKEWVCKKLVWNDVWSSALLDKKNVTCDDKESKTTCPELMPQTCATVQSLRVEEIASSAETLYAALAGDLVDVATQAVVERVTKNYPQTAGEKAPEFDDVIRVVFKHSLRIVLDSARKRTPPTERHAQLLIEELRTLSWDKSCTAGPTTAACMWGCGGEATFALVDECMPRGSCTPADVRSLVQSITSGGDAFELNACKAAFGKATTD